MSNFVRTHISYFGYFIISFYAFVQMGLGPIMPYLSDELHINDTQSGLYVTFFASGMIMASLLTAVLRKYFVRKTRLHIGFFGFIAALSMFLAVSNYVSSLIAIFLVGLISSIAFIAAQAILSDHHGSRRDTALTEANIFAASTAVLCPLILGSLAKAGFNWRFGIIIPAVVAVIYFIFYMTRLFHDPRPVLEKKSDAHESYPTLLLYLFCFAGFLGVCAEWGFMFWAPEYFEKILGFEKSDASLMMSVLYTFFVIGRIIGSRLTLRFQSISILIVFIIIGMVLFPFFWIKSLFIINFIAFAFIALCVANFFPLTLSIVMGIFPTRSDLASALITISAGSAMVLAPLTLGIISDNSDLKTAYLSVAVILVLLFITVFSGKIKTGKISA